MSETKSSLSATQIKKYKKLQDKAEENTQNTGYFIDEFDYYYGNLAEDLISAGDKEWALRTAAFVYLMELSVPPLNYRWYLRKTLKRSALRYVTNSKLEYI